MNLFWVGTNSDLWRICLEVGWLRGSIPSLPLVRMCLSVPDRSLDDFFYGVLVFPLVFLWERFFDFIIAWLEYLLYSNFYICLYSCTRLLLFIYIIYICHSKKIKKSISDLFYDLHFSLRPSYSNYINSHLKHVILTIVFLIIFSQSNAKKKFKKNKLWENIHFMRGFWNLIVITRLKKNMVENM